MTEEIYELIQITILVIGLSLTAYAIKRNTDAVKTNLLHDMNNEERNLSMEVFKKGTEINQKKREIEKATKVKIISIKDLDKIPDSKFGHLKQAYLDLTEQTHILITQHLNFFEHLALLILNKKIDEELAKRYYKSLVFSAVENYEPVLGNALFSQYTEFNKLYNRWSEK
jgi:hypothetical protein